ncbi:hypothetical protein NOR_06417 [Metarhizium rileyi]|uniref:Uncharacterized protein n=1 Tax=Metarhizium rileyi (strain RCEF 4871) TaxID=1649241 RepID=A0A167AQ29_METRR|nr:hypothetical protein NOR_06417 [Metarhizium rileyi RCEF 4871]TWU73974.1 hypothetical protein ED733_005282 [Metarhizium rileyi]
MADSKENTVTKGEKGHSQRQPPPDWPEAHSTETDGKNSKTANHKDKGKNTGSMADRIQSSGRAMIQGAISDKGLPAVSLSQKGGGESSASANFVMHQTISESEQQEDRKASANMTQESFRLELGPQVSSDAFEAFAAGKTEKFDSYTTGILDAPEKDKSAMAQEALDGLDVVDLLSQPEIGHSHISEEPEEMTPTEVARLRAALFESGSSWPFWDQVLNFNPDFVARAAGSGENAHVYMGTTDAELAQSTWLRQWNNVLSSYTDEVWGDLSTLAMEAKQELQQCSHTQEMLGASTTALKRLRLILNHVRGKC